MCKPQKAGGPKMYQAFYPNGGDTMWTCWQKADGEFTRGWGVTPNAAYREWLYKTLIAEGMSKKAAQKRTRETDYD